jgi:hypothetical protein
LLQASVLKPYGKQWVLGFSSGVFWDGFATTGSFIYNGNAAYSFIQKKWTITTEVFGFINGTAPQHNADISISYNNPHNWQLGCTAGTGLSTAAHKNYFAINGNIGFSTKKTKRIQP